MITKNRSRSFYLKKNCSNLSLIECQFYHCNPSGTIELWEVLFTLKIATPQYKAFFVLEFAKTNAIVMVQSAFKKEFGIDVPHRESIQRWVKRLDACAKEIVLEDYMSQRCSWREFTMHLKRAHISLHVEQIVSLRSCIRLSGIC